MSLVQNERTKLTANWLNALAAGIVITGVVAPLVASIYGVAGPSQAGYVVIAVLSLIWFAVGTALHFVARRMLARLRE
jgi:hypothetical protein